MARATSDSRLAAAKAPIRQAALHPMRRLVDACNETALLGIYDRTRQQMIFVVTVESTHELRVVTPLNRWLPIHVGASGLAILAFLEPDEAALAMGRIGPERQPGSKRSWRGSASEAGPSPKGSGRPARPAWPRPSSGAAARFSAA